MHGRDWISTCVSPAVESVRDVSMHGRGWISPCESPAVESMKDVGVHGLLCGTTSWQSTNTMHQVRAW